MSAHVPSSIYHMCVINGPRHEKNLSSVFANNKGAARPICTTCSAIVVFLILGSIISKLKIAISQISIFKLVSIAEQACA